MTAAISFRHIGIIVDNMKESLQFYTSFLGFEVIQDFWDDSEYINTITKLRGANVHMIKMRLRSGDVLELLEYVTHPTALIEHPVHNVGICHLAIEVDDIDKMHANAKERGYRVLSRPTLSSEGIAKVFFVMDPNNVRIELVEMVK